MAHAGGQPTKLTKETIVKATQYDYVAEGQVVPTIEGLAIFLNVNRETIYAWQGMDIPLAAEFSNIVKKLMSHQALQLVNKGLNGTFNSRVVNMMLSRHGYVERTEQDVTHSGAVQFVNDVPRPNGNTSS